MNEQKRRRHRLYARKKMRAKWEGQAQGKEFCPLMQGGGRCGGRLEERLDHLGRVILSCPRCARRRKGICQDCPRPVAGRVGHAKRCAECKQKEKLAAVRRYELRHPEKVHYHREWARKLKQTDPARYAHRLATKKVWREKNRTKIKLQKRKWRLNPDRPGGYSSREKHDEYHRRYRESHRQHYRDIANARNEAKRLARGPIICNCGCGQEVPWDGRYRPHLRLEGHYPYRRHPNLTPEDIIMKAAQGAIRMLERAKERVEKKLAGREALLKERDQLAEAIAALRPLAGNDEVTPIAQGRRGRRAASA